MKKIAATAIFAVLIALINALNAVTASAVYTPIIDAGHGGEDGGAVSADGVLESTLNLAVAKRLRDIFSLFGTETVMTRSDDNAVGDQSLKTVRARKGSDLKRRVQLANDTKDGFLISIHQNSFTDRKYGGAQIFYTCEESREMAELLQESIKSKLTPENNRVAKPVAKGIFLFDHIRCPAALVECGFLSNAEDTARLVGEDYQKKLAAAIYSAFIVFCDGDEQIIGE